MSASSSSDSEGRALVDAVATPERAVGVIGELVGDTIAFGPVEAGPGGMATATARGTVGRMRATSDGPAHVTVTVPVVLDLAVEIGRRTVPVEGRLAVRIGLHSCLAADASEVVVEVDEIGPADIDVSTRASGVGGVLVRRLGDLDNEIRHHVIAWVTDLLTRPEAHAARRIPVGAEAEPA